MFTDVRHQPSKAFTSGLNAIGKDFGKRYKNVDGAITVARVVRGTSDHAERIWRLEAIPMIPYFILFGRGGIAIRLSTSDLDVEELTVIIDKEYRRTMVSLGIEILEKEKGKKHQKKVVGRETDL